MTAVIKTDKLTKYYGKHRGIIELDLEIEEGESFGFLGPNGAGKTTMIRTLLDHIRPTSARRRSSASLPATIRLRSIAGSATSRVNSRRTTSSPAVRRSTTSPTCAVVSIAPTRSACRAP